MEAAARNGPGVDVLHAILPSLDDRNAEVAAKVCVRFFVIDIDGANRRTTEKTSASVPLKSQPVPEGVCVRPCCWCRPR